MQRVVDVLEIIICMLLLIILLLIHYFNIWHAIIVFAVVGSILYVATYALVLLISGWVWVVGRIRTRSARQASEAEARELESRSAAARERVRRKQASRDALWERVKHHETRRK